MSYSESLANLSVEIQEILSEHESVPVKDYGWNNYIWKGDKFRSAHLEEFYTDKVSVLHCVIMPHTNHNAPIYGFDVIEINGMLTGMFLDLTPVNGVTYYLPPIGESRPVPDWGDFFSPSFVCCKPSEEDLQLGIDVLKKYMFSILPGEVTGSDYSDMQQVYVDGQRRNPQTYKMLKSHVGEELAQEFMTQVLFPDVPGV